MRDAKRIPEVLDAIRKVWETAPDLRLGQLISCLAGTDPFYIEDDKLVEKAKEMLQKVERYVCLTQIEGDSSSVVGQDPPHA